VHTGVRASVHAPPTVPSHHLSPSPLHVHGMTWLLMSPSSCPPRSMSITQLLTPSRCSGRSPGGPRSSDPLDMGLWDQPGIAGVAGGHLGWWDQPPSFLTTGDLWPLPLPWTCGFFSRCLASAPALFSCVSTLSTRHTAFTTCALFEAHEPLVGQGWPTCAARRLCPSLRPWRSPLWVPPATWAAVSLQPRVMGQSDHGGLMKKTHPTHGL
jgi:hypothetical protein